LAGRESINSPRSAADKSDIFPFSKNSVGFVGIVGFVGSDLCNFLHCNLSLPLPGQPNSSFQLSELSVLSALSPTRRNPGKPGIAQSAKAPGYFRVFPGISGYFRVFPGSSGFLRVSWGPLKQPKATFTKTEKKVAIGRLWLSPDEKGRENTRIFIRRKPLAFSRLFSPFLAFSRLRAATTQGAKRTAAILKLRKW
jgi:hypothetical protein